MLPILFLPGTLCTPDVFETQIKELATIAPQVEAVRFNLEDSISKMADTAIETIRPHRTAAVIGFSMGGTVAMEIARKQPELIGKLALINTNYLADSTVNRSARLLHLQQANSEGMERVIRQHYLHRYLHKHSVTAQKLIVDMARELGPACFAAQIKAHASRPDSSATLRGIQCPTLILGAEQDGLCPPAVQKQIHQMIKGSELVMLEACGHFSMQERPREVNKALRDWYLAA